MWDTAAATGSWACVWRGMRSRAEPVSTQRADRRSCGLGWRSQGVDAREMSDWPFVALECGLARRCCQTKGVARGARTETTGRSEYSKNMTGAAKGPQEQIPSNAVLLELR